MALLGISKREFARRAEVSDTFVRKQIKGGYLNELADGSLDPADLDGEWRKTAKPGANQGANSPANQSANQPEKCEPDDASVRSANQARFAPAEVNDEDAKDAAERIITNGGPTLSLAQAERVKENYLALLRQLEYDIKAGAVVAVEDVARAVGEEYAKVRTRLMAIPAEQAPRLHSLKTVAEVQDVLTACIVEALEELTRDRAGGG